MLPDATHFLFISLMEMLRLNSSVVIILNYWGISLRGQLAKGVTETQRVNYNFLAFVILQEYVKLAMNNQIERISIDFWLTTIIFFRHYRMMVRGINAIDAF